MTLWGKLNEHSIQHYLCILILCVHSYIYRLRYWIIVAIALMRLLTIQQRDDYQAKQILLLIAMFATYN